VTPTVTPTATPTVTPTDADEYADEYADAFADECADAGSDRDARTCVHRRPDGNGAADGDGGSYCRSNGDADGRSDASAEHRYSAAVADGDAGPATDSDGSTEHRCSDERTTRINCAASATHGPADTGADCAADCACTGADAHHGPAVALYALPNSYGFHCEPALTAR